MLDQRQFHPASIDYLQGGYFKSLVQNVLDIITVVDGTGIIRYESPAVERIRGFKPDELIGKSAFDFIHPEDLPTVLKVFQEGIPLPGATASLEFRCLRKDNSWCHLEAVGKNLLHDPVIAGIVVTSRDATERKKGEDALRQTNEFFRSAFANASVGLIIKTPHGRFLQANSAFLGITGYSLAELLATDFFSITHPEDLARNKELFRGLLAGDQPSYVLEKRLVKKGGDNVWVRCSVSLIRNPQGEPAYVIALVEDITEHRRLEEQYRQSQKMEAVGRLAGGVAHDFNNLLTIINGYGQIVLDNLALENPARELVREITGAGERAASLTRQLLAFSRKQIVSPQVIDLVALVTDTEKMLQRLIGEDIRLTPVIDPELWLVKVDPGQMEQVLLNLAINSRDAMPKGGKLTIEAHNIRLDETYTRFHPGLRPGPYVLLAVSDTGFGMDSGIRARIFEPFFSTKGEKGTGLGLATVYGIIKQAGGHIEVYSEPTRGTTFKIYLPRTEEMTATGKSSPGIAVLPGGKETILLVEDEDGVRALTRHVLQNCGYKIMEASDGAEALTIGKQHRQPIDLLVTDVVMPKIGGREVADKMAEHHPEIKVLFLSGYTDDAVVRHGILEKEVAFLQKPFGPASLALKVREVLDQPRPHRGGKTQLTSA